MEESNLLNKDQINLSKLKDSIFYILQVTMDKRIWMSQIEMIMKVSISIIDAIIGKTYLNTCIEVVFNN
ncbi:hypothetical protein QQP08_019854 [Theobroma cacao]|nr:hypothetical protein QQP08_019854 [Theobroma cacao]